tara:strand:+ start:1152 stop:3872 length:2721 start_codon:yes stop_codon:yes gene_type:complete
MSYIKLLKNALLLNLVFISVAATAQEIEEVVVTATKKAESIQDVAISIEAFTADQLARDQVYDLSDLAEVVPGLEVSKGVGSGSAFSMRGIGSYGVGAAVVSSMVTSVNGHSTNVSTMNDMGFMDLERIEVLKGPQGTLFGRNSVAGVINLVTARPSNEVEGSFSVERGKWGKETTTAVINVPFSDSIRSRVAFSSNKRDGMVINGNTGNTMDDRNDLGLRLSLDWDISDQTQLKLTYSEQSSDDNRPQEEVSYCKQDMFYGCSPYVKGDINTSADTRGTVTGLFGFFALFDNGGTVPNRYGSSLSQGFETLYLDREPVHEQDMSIANLELIHDINDSLKMVFKYSYDNRDFYQMNDNDGSVSSIPLTGAGAPLGLPPISANLCFGTSTREFCEVVNSERGYDFSEVSTWSDQAEINIISDYEGPVNFTVGYYNFDQRSDNEYRVQTAGTQMMTSFANHPYNAVFKGMGIDFSGKGGIAAYQAILGALATGFANPTVLGAALASDNAVVPWDLGGTINDQHVRIKSKALYGEIYVDISEATKLTVGLRYNDDTVVATTYNDLAGQKWVAYGGALKPNVNKMALGFTTRAVQADDAFAYKLALQHDISDDLMVYGSYTTATKAGGVNAGSNPGTYDAEESAVLDFGIKSILLDGAMLLNMNIFSNDNKGMLLATIEDTGSHNYNTDAEIIGFEGLMSVYLSETDLVEFSWLRSNNKIVSETMAVNYMNPTGATGTASYLGAVDPSGVGAITAAVANNGVVAYRSAGFNCTTPFVFTTGCPAAAGVEVNMKGFTLPGTTDLSYSFAYTKMFNSDLGMTSARLAYRYRGKANGDPFGMARFDIPAQKTIDLLVRYTPNDANWYTGFYAKNLMDNRQLNSIRASSNLQGGMLYGSFTDPRTYGFQFGTSF